MEPLAVRADQLAKLLGCSVRKVREMTRELPHVRCGGVVLYPVEEVRRFLAERARKQMEGR